MGRSVQISTEIPPPLSMAKRLGIPKARQEELSKIFEEAVRQLKVVDHPSPDPVCLPKQTSDSNISGDKRSPRVKIASIGDRKKRSVAAAAR